KQMDFAVLALQQHLGDSGGCSKISINLKGWMIVPENGQGTRGELITEQLVRAITIEQARPQINLPGLRPAGAAIAARIQRSTRARQQFFIFFVIDLTPRVQRKQMGHMAMIIVRIIKILLPFLQLTPGTDAKPRIQLRQRLTDALLKSGIAQLFRSSVGIGEEIKNDLLRHGRSHREVPVFRRIAWRYYQQTITGIFYQGIQPELR